MITLATATLALFMSPASEGLNGKNYIQRMSPGINLGNTLEAIPLETSWGNPVPTQKLMNGYRAAGFRSIRIPVAYSQYASSVNTIDKKWMAHVTDVVKMARRADLYVMLNVHWDGGWLQPTYAKQESANSKQRKFWTQIAANFRDFDDHLLFAGTNEVHVDDQYGAPTTENSEVQNGFNQIFVDTVRAAGGRNRSRFLVVQSYNTDIDAAAKGNIQMPKDPTKDRMMMEVHFYSPYNFTLNEKSAIWQWGKTATDPKFTDTWGNEDYVDAQFEKMKKAFVDVGVPVILGEYGFGLKPKFPGMAAYANLWTGYVTKSAFQHGMVPMYWDTGTKGGLVNRTTGAKQNPTLISLINKAVARK